MDRELSEVDVQERKLTITVSVRQKVILELSLGREERGRKGEIFLSRVNMNGQLGGV